jgi:hypothetical protein
VKFPGPTRRSAGDRRPYADQTGFWEVAAYFKPKQLKLALMGQRLGRVCFATRCYAAPQPGGAIDFDLLFQTLNCDTDPSGSAEASTAEHSNSRPHWKQTLYVRCLMVNTRLSLRCRHRKTNSKTHSSGFMRPAIACVRNFHCCPATPAGRERWPEPGQWSSQRLRSKCSPCRRRGPSCIRTERRHH